RLGAALAGDAALIVILERVSDLTVLRVSAAAAALLYPGFLLVPGVVPKLAVLAALSAMTAPWYPVLQARLYGSLPGRSSVAVTLSSAAGLAGGGALRAGGEDGGQCRRAGGRTGAAGGGAGGAGVRAELGAGGPGAGPGGRAAGSGPGVDSSSCRSPAIRTSRASTPGRRCSPRPTSSPTCGGWAHG